VAYAATVAYRRGRAAATGDDGGTERPRLALDAIGGDGGWQPCIEAALILAQRCRVILVGPQRWLEEELATRGRRGDLEVCDAAESVGMGEDPIAATSDKRRSSLHVAAALVASGRADAMLTAGNTGAAVLAGAVRMRRLSGVLNPALATLLPAPGATPTVLLDIGATTACPPAWLAQFATMGAAYARARLSLIAPRIGLLSNGSESIKGGPAQQDAHGLLMALPGYIGHVEAYDLLGGRADVVVCDGFTGDVALKMYERTLDVTAEVTLNAGDILLGARTGRRLRRAADHALRATLAAEPGGVLLGVGGVCVVCHGAARVDDLVRAGDIAAECVRLGLPGRVGMAVSARPARSGPVAARRHQPPIAATATVGSAATTAAAAP
jgi:glycerol-3-phosphate acyltransferase PlsX